MQKQSERDELKDLLMKDGDEIRKSLLDKLFSLNTLLSATFLVLFQLNINSFEIKILNILPFCTVTLILLHQLYDLRILGSVYHKLENWKKDDFEAVIKMRENNFKIILITIILTLVEIGYLFYGILK